MLSAQSTDREEHSPFSSPLPSFTLPSSLLFSLLHHSFKTDTTLQCYKCYTVYLLIDLVHLIPPIEEENHTSSVPSTLAHTVPTKSISKKVTMIEADFRTLVQNFQMFILGTVCVYNKFAHPEDPDALIWLIHMLWAPWNYSLPSTQGQGFSRFFFFLHHSWSYLAFEKHMKMGDFRFINFQINNLIHQKEASSFFIFWLCILVSMNNL